MQLIPKPKNICQACWLEAIPNQREHLVKSDGQPNFAGAIFGTIPYLKVPFCSHKDSSGERIRAPGEMYRIEKINNNWYWVHK